MYRMTGWGVKVGVFAGGLAVWARSATWRNNIGLHRRKSSWLSCDITVEKCDVNTYAYTLRYIDTADKCTTVRVPTCS